MITAIITAAGMSKRMGEENKLLLPINGKAMFLHTVDAVLNSEIDDIILVTGYEPKKIKTALGNRKVKLIYNENYESGLTSSIQAGVFASSEKTKGYLICLSDMPLLKKEHINTILIESKSTPDKSIFIPKINNKRSHPILLSSEYKTEILEHQSPNGCKEIIKKNEDEIHFVYFSEDFSKDIDTPEAYKEFNEGN